MCTIERMRVDFFFGPGSRYSYLAATQLSSISETTGAVFRWRPVYSGELISRAGGTFKSPQDTEWRRRDAVRWARHYGVPFIEPKESADWRMIAFGCVAAGRMGAGERFGQAVLHLVYGQGLTPDLDHLLELASVCNLDRTGLALELQSPETAKDYEQNLVDALAAGAFGVPTFVSEQGDVVWGQDRLPLLKDYLLFGDVQL